MFGIYFLLLQKVLKIKMQMFGENGPRVPDIQRPMVWLINERRDSKVFLQYIDPSYAL
jgi:hypothetical protein